MTLKGLLHIYLKYKDHFRLNSSRTGHPASSKSVAVYPQDSSESLSSRYDPSSEAEEPDPLLALLVPGEPFFLLATLRCFALLLFLLFLFFFAVLDPSMYESGAGRAGSGAASESSLLCLGVERSRSEAPSLPSEREREVERSLCLSTSGTDSGVVSVLARPLKTFFWALFFRPSPSLNSILAFSRVYWNKKI